MFDNYKDSQNVVYSMLKNSIKLNKISHAYLIDSNRYNDIENFIKAVIKLFLCPYNYSNMDKCHNCSRCLRIENNNDPEVRFIYPDGLSIKKEQLMELQESFNMSSIEGNMRIYVIWDCDKMNVQAANSILKFLEEPVSNVVAILVTNNVDSLLPTIVSRCQYVKLNNDNFYSKDTLSNAKRLLKDCGIYDVVSDDDIFGYIDDVINFILYYEEHGLDILIYMKKMWHDKFSERNYYVFGFQLIIYLYYDILKYKFMDKLYFYSDFEIKVIKIANLINENDILNRISIYIKYLEFIKYNLNLNLLMDSLVIELGEAL